ncbi:histidine kinase [Massilia cavernae]|uniref:histidine kinase n=1 Tax=Massilia cavernae TaxID=2320864 RepID=A0A418XXW8_9BURK|nr:histidine kinase [Massilia cavernae]RJG17815.1 hypothetical protein D3872_10110 [Massilia cavernae]
MINNTRLDASLDDVDETAPIATMRIVLAVATILAMIIDPNGIGDPHPFTLLAFYAYTAHSAVIYISVRLGGELGDSKLVHWLDVFWFSLVLVIAGPQTGFFYLFFFAISTAAFRWGYDEGARVTLACAVLYCLAATQAADQTELARMLLRATFLLGLGYMVSHWAQASIKQKRRIALLRDVSRLSNPRFGVEDTIVSVLEQIRVFFGATSCFSLTRENPACPWILRKADSNASGAPLRPCVLDSEAAAPLVAAPPTCSALFRASLLPFVPWPGAFLVNDATRPGWHKAPVAIGNSLADILGGRSFICVPLPLRNGEGRIFVVAPQATLDKGDVRFLAQVVAQAVPVIENIELLDRMASDAARRERVKMSLDLHDTTVQPYIGMSHVLRALLSKAGDANPIAPDLRQVADMADAYIAELRELAGNLARAKNDEPAFPSALRAHASHMKEFYNLDIALSGHETAGIHDRLGAEVFQIVSEGVSNITGRARRLATRGAVEICAGPTAWLHIRIENECRPGPAAPFRSAFDFGNGPWHWVAYALRRPASEGGPSGSMSTFPVYGAATMESRPGKLLSGVMLVWTDHRLCLWDWERLIESEAYGMKVAASVIQSARNALLPPAHWSPTVILLGLL